MVPHVCCQFLLCLLGDSGFLVGCGGLSLDNISTMMLWREMYGILLRRCMICDIGRRVPHDIFNPPPPAPACNVSLNGLLKMLAIFSFIFSSLHPPPPAPACMCVRPDPHPNGNPTAKSARLPMTDADLDVVASAL